jgi:hypothetical protein
MMMSVAASWAAEGKKSMEQNAERNKKKGIS